MRRPLFVFLVLASGLAAFSRPMRADSTPQPQTAAAQPTILQTQESNTAGIILEVIECKRADGVLSLRMRLHNTTTATMQVRLISGRNFDHYYVVAGTKKYFVLRDSEDVPLAPAADGFGNLSVDVPRNGSWTWWAKYPAPPDTEKTVTYYTPLAPPVEAIPISG
jgi:hypothetical protein